jgi:hypothetical protein
MATNTEDPTIGFRLHGSSQLGWIRESVYITFAGAPVTFTQQEIAVLTNYKSGASIVAVDNSYFNPYTTTRA